MQSILHTIVVATLFVLCSTIDGLQKFDVREEAHKKEHLKQHLQDQIEIINTTTDQEAFLYFTMIDLNKDNRLDGLDILQAMTHSHDDSQQNDMVYSDEMIEEIVDLTLKQMDFDNDGFVDFREYVKSLDV
ncbi:hypothetical protein DICVIV_10107 [Dictyocaulus viviparus]|uniref:EF-hand domain-containing protein n=1 Tax=Dictyocaulus viviparus TaxID=29172 RepID=A0A0D8XGU0_DICVI|nr:hypothetical protein DICVIV_10107 [Dictyocaulus viviparus]